MKLGLDFIRWRTMYDVAVENCIRHFSIRRLVYTCGTLMAVMALIILTVFFRILDAIFFRGHAEIQVKEPVFIISNPRSGTTYLQRMMSLDQRFATMKVYHTLLPAISFYKLINLLGSLDRRTGHLMRRSLERLSTRFFAVWEDIHKAGLDQPEEDEGFWFLTGLSPSWSMIAPYHEAVKNIMTLDGFSAEKKDRIAHMYRDFLQRVLYMNPGKRLLVKSVMSAGRLNMIKESFPDARIILIDRSPLKTVPSYISMFSRLWSWHSPRPIKRRYFDLGLAAIAFQNSLTAFRKETDKEKFLDLEYSDLIHKTMITMEEVYDFIGMALTEDLKAELKKVIESRRTYRSVHNYNLRDYGYTEQSLRDLLAS